MQQQPILSPNLDQRERIFFAQNPNLNAVETQLQRWMADPQDPLRHELGIVFDGGQIKVVKGGQAANPSANATVSVDQNDLDQANVDHSNLVVTHNHPGGAPLSRGDVNMAIGRGILAIRAVGSYGTFVLQSQAGQWNIKRVGFFDAYGTGGPNALKQALSNAPERQYRPRDVNTPDIGETFDEDNFLIKHFACKDLATKYNLQYTYPNENTLIQARLALYEKRAARPDDKRAGFRFDL